MESGEALSRFFMWIPFSCLLTCGFMMVGFGIIQFFDGQCMDMLLRGKIFSEFNWPIKTRTLYFLLFLFSYALIFLNFENRRFSFVFPSVGKNLQFSLKTEGFLYSKSDRKLLFSFKTEGFQRPSVFLQN